MRRTLVRLCLSLLFSAAISSAQEAPVQSPHPAAGPDHPWKSSVYCSGFFSSEKMPDDLRLVSSEQSETKITFMYGDIVYLSKGSSQGVREGDRFSVIRPDHDPLEVPWFKWQEKLTNAMGSYYLDLGQLTVIKTEPNVSIAKVSFSCSYMQRAD